MIIRAFRENQTFTLLLSFLLIALVWAIGGLYKEYEPDHQTLFNSPIYYLFPSLKVFNSLQLLSSAINAMVLLGIGTYLSKVAFKFLLLPKRSFLPLFFIVLISLPYFTIYSGISYSLISVGIVLKVLHILFSSLEKKRVGFEYFDSALLISLASIFNFYTCFLLFFLIFALLQFKGLQLRELVFIVLGLILPYALLIGCLYLANKDITAFIDSYAQMFSFKLALDISITQMALFVFSGLLIIIGSLHMLKSFVKMKIITRKYSVVFFGLFIISLLITLFFPLADRDILFYLALPISYLFAFYFATCQIKLVNQILFVLLIVGNAYVFLKG